MPSDWGKQAFEAHKNFRVDAVENRCPWCLQIRPMDWFQYQHRIDKDTAYERSVTACTTRCRNCRRVEGQSPSRFKRRIS